MIGVLEDRGDGAVVQELASFVAAMSETNKLNCALTWLGRAANTIEDGNDLRTKAARTHAIRTAHTANYLLGMPLGSDYLEEAASLFGHSCE